MKIKMEEVVNSQNEEELCKSNMKCFPRCNWEVHEQVDEREAIAKYRGIFVKLMWIDKDKVIEGEPMQIKSRTVASGHRVSGMTDWLRELGRKMTGVYPIKGKRISQDQADTVDVLSQKMSNPRQQITAGDHV